MIHHLQSSVIRHATANKLFCLPEHNLIQDIHSFFNFLSISFLNLHIRGKRRARRAEQHPRLLSPSSRSWAFFLSSLFPLHRALLLRFFHLLLPYSISRVFHFAMGGRGETPHWNIIIPAAFFIPHPSLPSNGPPDEKGTCCLQSQVQKLNTSPIDCPALSATHSITTMPELTPGWHAICCSGRWEGGNSVAAPVDVGHVTT